MSDAIGGAPAPAAPVVASNEAVADPGIQLPAPVRADPPAPEAVPEPKKEPETPKAKEPVSTRDALTRARDKVEQNAKAAEAEAKAKEGGDKGKPAEPAKPAPAAEPKGERPADRTEGPVRDEAGKFASASQPTSKPVDAVLQKPATEPAAKPQGPVSEAPARFSPEAKAEWANAPERVRAETSRAIDEMTRGIEKYRTDAEEFGKLREYHEVAKANGRDLSAALSDMKALEDAFGRSPFEGYEAVAARLGHGSFRKVAEAFLGRTPDQHAAQAEQAVGQFRSQAAQLQQQLAQVTRERDSLKQQAETAQASALEGRIADFSKQPGHERFDELRTTIGRLLSSGMADDIAEAYDMAAQLKPGKAPAPPSPPAPAPVAAPAPAPAVAQVIDLAAQTRGEKSITGAPSSGSDPVTRKGPPPTIREALRRAAAQAAG